MASIKYTPNHIWTLIAENNIDSALKILTGIQDGSAWVHNATAICWMRLGKPEKATSILLDMVYKKNSVIMRTDSSDVTKLNLAAALLMEGNIEGAMDVLNAVEHPMPMKEKLSEAIQTWKKRQPLWSRMAMFVGIYPNNKPVKLDFPPGQIEVNVKDILEG